MPWDLSNMQHLGQKHIVCGICIVGVKLQRKFACMPQILIHWVLVRGDPLYTYPWETSRVPVVETYSVGVPLWTWLSEWVIDGLNLHWNYNSRCRHSCFLMSLAVTFLKLQWVFHKAEKIFCWQCIEALLQVRFHKYFCPKESSFKSL